MLHLFNFLFSFITFRKSNLLNKDSKIIIQINFVFLFIRVLQNCCFLFYLLSDVQSNFSQL